MGALPAVRALRDAYPYAYIAIICNEYVQGALDDWPMVDQVIYGFGYGRRPAWKRIGFRLKLLAQIVCRYDIALSLRMAPRAAPLLSLVSGAQMRVGYHQPGLTGHLLTHDLGGQPHFRPNRVTNLDVVRAIGVSGSPDLPRLDWIRTADRNHAEQLLSSVGIEDGEPFAVFQISSHWGCYEWRSDKWAALAEHLTRLHGFKVVVVGAGEDFEMRKFEELAELTSVPISLQGMTTLPMLFHVVSRASLVVATDSALTQIAIAQRVPSVILFGIEPMMRNGPLPDEAKHLMDTIQHWDGPELARAPNPHCLFGQSHCHTQHCCENSSFERITAGEVCDRVDRIVTTSGSRI